MSPAGASPRSGRVRVPADVDRPDRILAGLTARQLAILAAAAVVLWAGYAATRRLVPPVVYAVFAVPAAGAAIALAVGRIEGIGAERFLISGFRHWRAPHRLVTAPNGVPAPPASLARAAGPTPAPLRLPIVDLGDDGTLDLGADGRSVMARARAAAFSLRTPAEQEAMTAGFARWLNSLSEPTQILIRSEPADLRPAIAALEDSAPGLPHPALETAARDHARFLAELAAEGLLSRQVLVVLRQPRTSIDADGLARRAAQAAGALGTAGVALEVLDQPAAAGLLSRAVDPANLHPPPGGDTERPVTYNPRRSEP